MLSDDQFSGLAQRVNEGGGFSVRTHGPKAGEEAENAFMVGTLRHGQDVPMPTSGGTLKGFAESRRPELSRTDRFMGGWAGGKAASLDVSQAFPLTKRGEVGARRMGIAEGQKAIGKVGPGGEYQGDVMAPMVKRHGGKEGPQVPFHSAANKSWVYGPVKSRRPKA
jgi:hypothetical protein